MTPERADEQLARYADAYGVPLPEVQSRFAAPWRALADVVRPSLVLSLGLFAISVPFSLRRAVGRSLRKVVGPRTAAIASLVTPAALVALEVAAVTGKVRLPTFIPAAIFLSAALLVPFGLAFFPASRSVPRMQEWLGALIGRPFDQLLLQARLVLLRRATNAAGEGQGGRDPVPRS